MRRLATHLSLPALLVLGLGAVPATLPAPAWAQAAGPHEPATIEFSIAAGSLSAALGQFGAQAGVPITTPAELVQGRQTPGVQGRYGVEQGLELLLAGTGLQAVPGRQGGYVLRAAPGEARALEAVTVSGRLDATSEGSGSYAAQAVSLFKGARSLREIPQSVSVMTRGQMDDQGLTRLEQVYTQMAGARVDGYSNESRIISRGFEAGTQIDGVPTAGSGLYQVDPVIYDRVEMMRGPAGLLSGSGEPGGTVNLVRKRARQQFALTGSVAYGSWQDRRVELDVTGPLSADGALRGRAVGLLQDRNEFYEVAHERRKLLYGTLEYDLTPRDTVGVAATYMSDLGNSFFGLPRYTDGRLPDRNAFVGTTDVPTRKTVRDVTVDYRHRFDSRWQAEATYSLRDEDSTQGSVYGWDAVDPLTGLAPARGSYGDYSARYQAFDLNLSGPFSLFGRTHQALIGFNQLEDRWTRDSRYAPYYPAADILNRHEWGVSTDDFAPDGYGTLIRQSGLYGSLNLRVLEPLALIVGGRYSNVKYWSRSNEAASWQESQHARGEFTPYAGLVWDLDQDLAVYGSYAEIFVPQNQRDSTGSMLKPRTGKQFEVGVKGAFLDGRLNASLAVYQLRDENRAVDDLDPMHFCEWGAGGRCATAAGKIQSRGVELEMAGTPLPGLNLSASYTYNRSKYLSDADPALVGTTPEPYRNPRHLFKLWALYRFADGGGTRALAGWSVGAGVVAQSAIHNDAAFLARPYRQGGYAVVSARLGYRVNKNLSIDFDVDNLFDRTYLSDLGDDGYYNMYGRPRSFRVSLVYRLD